MAEKTVERIFVSYARQDQEFAVQLARDLMSAGFLVWIDRLDLLPGARWDNEIEKALRTCSIFLPILTPASGESDNVMDEIGYAIDNKKQMLPVMYKRTSIPLRLRRFQTIDFSDRDYAAGFTDLVKHLGSNFNIRPMPPASSAEPANGEQSAGELPPRPYLCVSYHRSDGDLEQVIVTELRARGVNLWVDVEYIIPGTPSWEQHIERAIRDSAGLIVLLSPESNNSEGVRREISLAEQHAKRVFPVLIRGSEDDSVPLRLSAHQRADLQRDFARGLDELTNQIEGHLGNTLGEKKAASNAPQQQVKTNQVPATKAGTAPKQEATTPRDPAIAEKIGSYQITEEIGRGGFGTVYRAYDRSRKRDVAIKALPSELARSDPQFKTRFEREGKNIILLAHHAIVPVYDLIEQNDRFYIVMGYMPGGNLRGRIGQKQFTLEDTVRILNPVASGLDYAAKKGFVHRDLKPGNILFDDQNYPCISDLVDSRLFQEPSGQGNAVYGTPAYMAPEEVQGDPVDSRTHIYTLGVILFEMLAGHPPFQADTPMAIAIKHITDPVPNIRDDNPSLPIEVDAVIQKAMAKNKADRFATAQEMVNALNALLPAGTISEDVSSTEETEPTVGSPTESAELSPEQIAEREARLQAAIAANLLANNRSQAVFNDKAQGEDQLGIKNEVEALAETLLLRDVEPPVAVGVMGGWGSGKSFVMYLIDQYVQRIRAQQVRKGWPDSEENPSSSLTVRAAVPADTPVRDGRTGDPKIPVFVGHVYQIHFNAWTYAKSNLWASLMDTIFSCLNRQMQLERLLAHREFSPEKPPTKEQIRDCMMAGGEEFKKIYLDNPQLGQDKDLAQWRRNLEHWSQHLLKGTLLWNIMRGQQVETLEKLKDTEEQLNQLKARREQFEKDRPLDEITAKDLDPTARKAYLQSIKSFMLAFLSDQLSTVAKDELKKQDVKEEDVQKYLKEAKGLWGGLKTVVTAFRRSKLYLIWTLIFFALTFALPYVWKAYDLEFVQLQVAKIISWVLTLLPTLAIILPWIKKSMEASVEAKKILEGAYVAQQAKHAEEIANSTDMPLPQKISELQADISRGSVAAYDALIGLLEAQAEEQRQKIGPSAKYSNLMEFVQSRLDAATYENQLGLMHQVRQDIDELTFSLVDNASPDVFPRGKPRVILYIDDLDRCPPPRVVEMLEAVQLLLNTKLFIVILGLDTRYVTRALEKEYKEILQHEGDPSGLDYIEKIIQIPYRVRAIEKDNLRLYIEKQMDIEKTPEPEPAAPSTSPVQEAVAQASQPEQNQAPQAPGQPSQGQPVAAQPTHDLPSDESSVPSQTAEPVQPPAAIQQDEIAPTTAPQPASLPSVESPSELPKPLEIELPAAVIQFKQEDLDDLAICCHKVVLTPRSIKRLVNVFKLMKIFWFRADKDAGIAERDRPRAVKQAAMTLLALSSAYPEVMREVFVHLDVLYRQGQEKTELFTALHTIKLPPGSANELSWQLQKYKADITALKAIAGNGQDQFGQLTLQDLKLSTFNIVRSFSFVGDPVYWGEGEDEIGQHSPPAKAKPNSKRK